MVGSMIASFWIILNATLKMEGEKNTKGYVLLGFFLDYHFVFTKSCAAVIILLDSGFF